MKAKNLSAILTAGLLTPGMSTNAVVFSGETMGQLLGGVIGHQMGGGRGKTLATVGGTLAGAYIVAIWARPVTHIANSRQVAYRCGYAAGMHRHHYHHYYY